MTLPITLPQQLEDRLRQEAERRGQEHEAVALRVLDQHLPPASAERRAAAVALLKGWAKEDEDLTPEELRANEKVLQAVDEDRPSDCKLFTGILGAKP